MAWPSLLVQRGVLWTLAPRRATRAPGVVVAPRVRNASLLQGLLYAFWSRRSRRASVRPHRNEATIDGKPMRASGPQAPRGRGHRGTSASPGSQRKNPFSEAIIAGVDPPV